MKHCLLSLLFLLFLLSCSQKSPSPPNIVLLFADDLGYGDLSSYGHPSIHTPNLDALAAKGIKFTNFYSGSPACTASRYALLTGRYPKRSGFQWVLYPNSSRGLHPEEQTLAEGLKAAGYATACYGKWHLGTTRPAYLPLQNGFDDYLGLPYSNDMIPPVWDPIPLLQGNDTLELDPDQSTLTKRYTEKAIDFISRQQQQPFFLYLPYAMPHLPLHPGKAFVGQSSRGKYGDVVEELDWSVGEILKTLEAKGLADNTLLIFTSDNGPWIIKNEEGGSSGLLRDGKGSTWEGGMRVPMVAYWKGKTAVGQLCQQPASTLDLYPSLLALAGQEIPSGTVVDGKNIAGLLGGNPSEIADQPFFYYGPNRLHAVRKGKWKLHIRTSSQTGKDYFNGQLPLLFNIEEDPSEQYDRSEEAPEVVAKLMAVIEAHQQQLEAQPDFFQQEREAGRRKHLALGKAVQLSPSPHPKYNKVAALTDGYIESPDFFRALTGFEGSDVEAIVDLEKQQSVESISVSFIHNTPSWIFLPQKVSCYTSIDGRNFQLQGSEQVNAAILKTKSLHWTFNQKIEPDTAIRYIKVVAESRGACPDGHDGAGKDCWIFMDEIVVE